VHRVPKHDSCCHQVQAAGPIALLLEAAIPDFAQPIEEHRPGQRIASFALVQPGVNAAALIDALQPFQDQQRSFDAPQLAQYDGQTVLAWVAAEFAHHPRGGHHALLDGGGVASRIILDWNPFFSTQAIKLY